jgi:PAS domain S-box-containing protein
MVNKGKNAGQETVYRVLVAVIFGLIGFGINFLDIELFEHPNFKVSILAGLLFPLLIALAWGWRYGLLSAVAGGCQTMWWLWRTDGYGFLYAVPIFTAWVVWHGYWEDCRRKAEQPQWYLSAFVVEVPFRIASELGFYTIFRWLVSFNPPPWNSSINWNYVPLSWVNTVAAKHTITAYLLLLAAHVLLSIAPMRRFFGLRKLPEERQIGAIYAAALLIGALLWTMDSVVEYLAFNPSRQTFWEVATLDVDSHELFLRNLFVLISAIAGVFVARFATQRIRLERKLAHTNRVLRAIRNVNQLISRETDRDRLVQGACERLIETHGYEHAWIALWRADGELVKTAEAGAEKRFELLEERLARGEPIPWIQRALAQADVVVVDNPFGDPEETHEQGQTTATRLEHAGRVCGLLAVISSAEDNQSQEEQSLLQEIAEDIALALRNIELEAEHAVAEAALRESEKRLRQVVENMPVMMDALDEKNTIIAWNRECERVTGYSAEEIVGNPRALEILYPDPTYREHILAQAEEHGSSFRNLEQAITCKNGSRRTISWSNISEQFPIPGWRTWAIGVDVTERVRAEKDLRQAYDDVEQRVRERTAELRKLVNAMAGREVRMAELKGAIRQLRAQLEDAGLKPVADDPLLGTGS